MIRDGYNKDHSENVYWSRKAAFEKLKKAAVSKTNKTDVEYLAIETDRMLVPTLKVVKSR